MNRCKVPTATTQVMEALIAANDFLTRRELHELLASRKVAVDSCHLSAALHHLFKCKAVDVLVQTDGAGGVWWYATPDTDARRWVIDERAPEVGPRSRSRKLRKSRKGLLMLLRHGSKP